MAFDDYTFSLFKIYMLRNPIKGVLLGSINKQQKKQLPKLFYKQIFPCLKNFI
jgi:hypothetical protein